MKNTLRRAAKTMAVLITLVFLLYAIEDFRGARAWRVERERLEAAGEVLNWADLAAKGLPPTTGSDAVNWRDPDLLTVPGFKLDFLARDIIDPATNEIDLKKWRRLLTMPPSDSTPAETDCEAGRGFLAATSKLQPVVTSLVAAARVGPIAHWPMNLDQPPTAIRVPPLMPLRRLMNLLSVRIAAHMACGRTSDAIDEMRIIAREEQSLRGLPFMITYLFGAALEDGLLSAIQAALSHGGLTAVERQEMDALLQQDWFEGARQALRAERNWLIYHAETGPVRTPKDTFISTLGPRLIPRGWLLRQALHISAFTEEADRLLIDRGHIDPKAVDALSPEGPPSPRGATPYNLIARISEPSSVRMMKTATALQTRIRMMRVAFAVVSYRERTGSLPVDLAALIPNELNVVPTEIVDRGPLRYRQSGAGFVVYSVGWDLIDTGGNPGLPYQSDWVLAIGQP